MDGKPYDPSGNAGRVAIQPGVGTLIFANPLERDEGFYQCNATNIMGTAISIKTYMRVACKWPAQKCHVLHLEQKKHVL